MSAEDKLVSIILLAHNKVAFTRRCLDALQRMIQRSQESGQKGQTERSQLCL